MFYYADRWKVYTEGCLENNAYLRQAMATIHSRMRLKHLAAKFRRWLIFALQRQREHRLLTISQTIQRGRFFRAWACEVQLLFHRRKVRVPREIGGTFNMWRKWASQPRRSKEARVAGRVQLAQFNCRRNLQARENELRHDRRVVQNKVKFDQFLADLDEESAQHQADKAERAKLEWAQLKTAQARSAQTRQGLLLGARDAAAVSNDQALAVLRRDAELAQQDLDELHAAHKALSRRPPRRSTSHDHASPRAMIQVLEDERLITGTRLADTLGSGLAKPSEATPFRTGSAESAEAENFLPAMRHWQRKYQTVLSDKT